MESEMMEILFVDDEGDLLQQAKVFLERIDDNIQIDTTTSPKEALNRLKKEDYDGVVSDYQMPEMDGLDLLERLRKDRETDIPFIMFTGKGEEEVALEALDLGADRFMQKKGDPETQYLVLSQAIKQEITGKNKKGNNVESEKEEGN